MKKTLLLIFMFICTLSYAQQNGMDSEQAVNFNSLQVYQKSNKKDLEKVSIYPTPIISEINLSFPSVQKEVLIEIYNVLGKKIFSIKKYNEDLVTLNINNVSSGVYLIKISNQQQSVTKRMIKN